jgi:hypothetical protein
MMDNFFRLIKVAKYAIQISAKFHVVTPNFRLFCLPYNFFSLLLYGKLVRTINFRMRRVVISSSI